MTPTRKLQLDILRRYYIREFGVRHRNAQTSVMRPATNTEGKSVSGLVSHLLNQEGEAETFVCSNSGISDSLRLLFLNAHNEARLSVAQGLEPNKCGSLPSAKNMYKLQWDCSLEQKAQDYIANCPTSMGSFTGLSQNLQSYTGITALTNIADQVASALTSWWGKVRQYGSTDPDNKYVDSNLYTFANDRANFLAHTCTGCFVERIGYYTNGVMWENGTACSSASDCTTYPGSTCAGGLCVIELEVPDAGTNTMCPSNANMTDATRQKFLDTHNYLRSRLANGLEPDALGGNAPKASKMLKMVYDCSVEASAIKHSKKCVYEHSASADRVGLGENLYMTTMLNADRVSSAAESSQLWWDELKEYGVGPANNLTQELWDRPNMAIGHYTQMAWDRTYRLGCSIQHCPTFTYAVCQYGPPGNYMNQLIYTTGEPCTSDAGCPGAYTCSVSEGQFAEYRETYLVEFVIWNIDSTLTLQATTFHVAVKKYPNKPVKSSGVVNNTDVDNGVGNN
ncbi:SCP-like protein [Teladorsagia circumcincta]|uniref:SCP-like protein n=1 Tax=Teladorsagia circumcincta TaxID=45464 RepID=A0A2G9V531_TELCI|nr:SCP-like protein [Teladorsagia circumcincta]